MRLPRGKDVLFEESLEEKFFQIYLEASAVDNLVFFTVMVRTLFFYSGESRVVSDQLRVLYP